MLRKNFVADLAVFVAYTKKPLENQGVIRS
jgi:hypothetical protein